jgi:hypothetical protein
MKSIEPNKIDAQLESARKIHKKFFNFFYLFMKLIKEL